jgi:CRISPR-associated protein Cas1
MMVKHTVEISRQPMHLAVKLGQLILQPFDAPSSEATSIPCEDIGVVLIEHPQTTYSHHALTALTAHGATIVVCGRDHLPAAIVLPLSDHSEVVSRLRDQINATVPTKKRLWQQLVCAKIRAQARNLRAPGSRRVLENMTQEVRSGDTRNIEAQAAKRYWTELRATVEGFGGFHRRPDGGDALNSLLNYGYAVLRAAVARTLVGAGLHPALGLHHRNRSNAFCLADDLVEPMRPLIDAKVIALAGQDRLDLTQANKAPLLAVLADTVQTGDETGPLMVALHRMTASLVRCLRRQDNKLVIPVALDSVPC